MNNSIEHMLRFRWPGHLQCIVTTSTLWYVCNDFEVLWRPNMVGRLLTFALRFFSSDRNRCGPHGQEN